MCIACSRSKSASSTPLTHVVRASAIVRFIRRIASLSKPASRRAFNSMYLTHSVHNASKNIFFLRCSNIEPARFDRAFSAINARN